MSSQPIHFQYSNVYIHVSIAHEIINSFFIYYTINILLSHYGLCNCTLHDCTIYIRIIYHQHDNLIIILLLNTTVYPIYSLNPNLFSVCMQPTGTNCNCYLAYRYKLIFISAVAPPCPHRKGKKTSSDKYYLSTFYKN